jgi:hypothetical protein
MDKEQTPQVQGNINLNMDTTPAIYADFAAWNINADGVSLNFGQIIMGSNQVKIYNRIGMSRQFIKRIMEGLGKDLALTEAQGQTGKSKS